MIRNELKNAHEYVRIGVDYFKVLRKKDRYGITRTELKKWNKEEIKLDHGAKYLHEILKYDDFIIEPDNRNFDNSSDRYYNLYAPFTHKPKPGEWPWTKILLEQIFAEQYEIGLKYIQCLYMHPKQPLPVLALISKERSTGKSTFLDWLISIFGPNMVIISPADLGREFNGSYSRANIIAIEETLIKKDSIVEKVKTLSTQKTINANLKNINDFQIPFYGKIIMASNNERKFMKIDEDEIRFFIRKLEKPKVINHGMLNEMIKEIPAFLDYLEKLPPIDFSKSRMIFTPEELANGALDKVKNESKSWLYKDLFYIFEDYFNNKFIGPVMKATPKEIKETFYPFNHNVSSSYIKEVIADEFKFKKAEKNESYKSLNDEAFKTGQPFYIPRDLILNPDDTMNPVLQVIEKPPF
jgi:hypothetical protein